MLPSRTRAQYQNARTFWPRWSHARAVVVTHLPSLVYAPTRTGTMRPGSRKIGDHAYADGGFRLLAYTELQEVCPKRSRLWA